MAHSIDMAPSDPWASPVIPPWTLATAGATTPNGSPAVFRSSTHAWIALRLVYLADVVGQTPAEIADRTAIYRQRLDRYTQHLNAMREIAALIADDVTEAARLWNSINQYESNTAFTTMLCEREGFPKVNLATLAQRHFGLTQVATGAAGQRDRKVGPRDHEEAWQASLDGRCRACGSRTISQRQHDRLRRTMQSHPELFDLTPNYQQTSGSYAPLWSSRLLIAAKGVADHIEPWSRGGRTSQDNLANVCAACNYSRNDASLDAVRVAAVTPLVTHTQSESGEDQFGTRPSTAST